MHNPKNVANFFRPAQVFEPVDFLDKSLHTKKDIFKIAFTDTTVSIVGLIRNVLHKPVANAHKKLSTTVTFIFENSFVKTILNRNSLVFGYHERITVYNFFSILR